MLVSIWNLLRGSSAFTAKHSDYGSRITQTGGTTWIFMEMESERWASYSIDWSRVGGVEPLTGVTVIHWLVATCYGL